MVEAGSFIIVRDDVDALLIPNATPITVPKGSEVQVTQALGGHITIFINGNLARIDQKDAAKLGIEPSELDAPILQTKQAKDKKITGPVDIETVWAALRTCFDPEIPVNVVDLGLIYECKTKELEKGSKNLVEIKMTLTAPGCGMGPIIVSDVEDRVVAVENVTDVSVELVFDPIWNQDMMSDAAKLELGML